MIGTTVYFTDEQLQELRAMARRKGLSLSAVVRRAIDDVLEHQTTSRAEVWSRAASLIGRFEDRDAATDLAESHDDYLA